MSRTSWPSGWWLLALCLALSPAAPAIGASVSKIDAVTVYPGLAVVERSARVAAGARELTLDCMTSAFDLATLQVEADAGVVVGPVTTSSRPRAQAGDCDNGPLAERIRSLEDRIAAVDAQSGGQDLALGYLKALAASDARGTTAASTPASLQATVRVIQQTGQTALAEQHRLSREREALTRELQPLLAERDRQRANAHDVRQLRIAISASKDSVVRLRYQVAGPTWSPSYRATLDTAGQRVDVERLAQVAQSTGEDWTQVNLRLSTGSPRSASSGPQPRPWTLFPRPMPRAEADRSTMAQAAPAAPASVLAERKKALEEPEFSVQVAQGEFSTEFVVAGKVDVASSGQRVSFAIGSSRLAAAIKIQATPSLSPTAWVVAEVARPDGVWPDGPMQLMRGAQTVGQTVWRVGQHEKIVVPFGRDELVRVQTNPSQERGSSGGFVGTRTERHVARSYEVENRHEGAVELQVLEASPFSTDERISVARRFAPDVQPGWWQEQPGVVAWTQTLAAGKSARFTADYTVSFPKDLVVSERY